MSNQTNPGQILRAYARNDAAERQMPLMASIRWMGQQTVRVAITTGLSPEIVQEWCNIYVRDGY